MQTKTRVVGSGFTSFNYRGLPIAFLESVTDSGQSPTRGAEAVTPLGARHPVEIATSRVLGPGTLTVSIRELWNRQIWEELSGLAGTRDIVEIFERIAADPAAITCQMIIRSPSGQVRGKTYHGCVVTRVPDGDSVGIDTLTVAKVIEITYTHTTPIG